MSFALGAENMAGKIAAGILVALLVPVSGGLAPAARAGATPTSAPAVGPAETKVLKDLEAAGEKHRTIRADVDYHVVNRQLGDSETRTGWVAYRKGDEKTPTKFRVTFETLRLGSGRKTREQVDYAFDGQWLTVAKHKIKNMTLYQLAAKGQRIEPLRIGKGPFPLPFGQKADDVVKHFEVMTRSPRPNDPENTVYLRLTTRPEFAKELSVQRLELWIDRTIHLPVKIRTRDKSRNDTTVTFEKIRTNQDVAANVFEVPRRLGWEVVRRPLKGTAKIGP
jgi:hypothetical protein